MSYWLDKLNEIVEKQRVEYVPKTLDKISGITLTEFSKRDLAYEIYSDVLVCKLWFCSNAKIAAQIKQDDPNAITYTAKELRQVINLKPSPKELNAINDAKLVFPNSSIVDSKTIKNNEEEHDY